MLGVAGAALLLVGALAAGGAWWGVAGLLHLAAGAGSVLLAAQAFVLHMYCQHWCGPRVALLPTLRSPRDLSPVLWRPSSLSKPHCARTACTVIQLPSCLLQVSRCPPDHAIRVRSYGLARPGPAKRSA